MSRVHDALRKAARESLDATPRETSAPTVTEEALSGAVTIEADVLLDMESILAKVKEFPYTPLPEALLINYAKPREAPGEEFPALCAPGSITCRHYSRSIR